MSASFNATKELVQSHMALDSCNLRCWRGSEETCFERGGGSKVNSQGWMAAWMEGGMDGWREGGMYGQVGRQVGRWVGGSGGKVGG